MKNERTSKRVAQIAGRVLEKLTSAKNAQATWISDYNDGVSSIFVCTVGELKALAASCLTQAPDKKRKAKP